MSLVEYSILGSNNNIALIRLNRPKALNALSQDLLKAIASKITEADQDTNINVIVITGNGTAFSAGADLKEASQLDLEQVLGDDQASVRAIYSAKKPVIAAVNGVAYGGGCELALMCDIIVASESARFGQPEVLVGTVPGWGGTQRLTRAVGKSLAMQLLLSGQSISASEAKAVGMISFVVDKEKLLPETIKLAEKIAEQSPKVVRLIKEATNKAFELSLEEGLSFERRMNQAGMGLKDRVEGMMAFVEKRMPKWTKAKM